MKTLICSSIFAMTVLAGCAGSKVNNSGIDSSSVSAINAQKLTTNFRRQGIKIEWECAWGTGALGMTDAMCSKGDLKSIEVTSYATSNGNSEANRETAFKVAEMQAKAKLRQFIQEDISTTSVVNTVVKNVEKANDRIKSRITSDDVPMSDDEASKEPNYAIRENTNDTVRTLTESIRKQSSGILKGVKVIDEKVVDRQTVGVTIRWDQDSDKASNAISRKFR